MGSLDDAHRHGVGRNRWAGVVGPGPAGGVEVAFVDHFGLEMFSREMWTRRRLIANCHWELEVGRGFKVGFTHTHARFHTD